MQTSNTATKHINFYIIIIKIPFHIYIHTLTPAANAKLATDS